MKELTEIRFNESRIILEDNLVKSPILPRGVNELDRDVTIKGNCRVDGPIYARNLEVASGPARICGAVFTQIELHVDSDATGAVVFEKSVGSAGAVVSHAPACHLQFLADVNATQVRLRNAYVAASIFADEIVLEGCVVVGGVFATRNLDMRNCVAGTFHAPTVRISERLYLLLPSAFSTEPASTAPNTECYNLTMADLGALMRGLPEAPESGSIEIDLHTDEQRTVLVEGEIQQTLRSYSVAGKVLAADLLETDKLQNHFLLSAAGLGSQLLKTYDLGTDVDGNPVDLTPDRISGFFFELLKGNIEPQRLDAKFSLSEVAGRLR